LLELMPEPIFCEAALSRLSNGIDMQGMSSDAGTLAHLENLAADVFRPNFT